MTTDRDILLTVIDDRERLRDKLLFSETEELRLLRNKISRYTTEFYFLQDYLSKKDYNPKPLDELLAEFQQHVNYNALLQYYSELQKINHHRDIKAEFENVKPYLPEIEKYVTSYELF